MLNILILMMIILGLSFIFKDKQLEGENYFLSYKYTNIMKGIAIVLVLVNHIGQKYNVSIIEPLGAVGVCIFLILSGYGINEAYNKSGKKDYFIKRFKRVIIPYWIVLLASALVLGNFNIVSILKRLLLIELGDGIFWYMRMIVFWYVAFYISKQIKNIKLRYTFMMLMSLFISLIFFNERLYLWQIFSFPFGVLLSDNIELVKKYLEKNFKYLGVISLVVSVIVVILKKIPYVDSRTYGFCDTTLQIIISLSLAIFIGTMVYILKNIRLWRVMEEIGKKSYEIYLIHPFFLYWLTDNSLLIMFIYILTVSILSILLNSTNSFLSKRLLKSKY